jgi:hypothetical protein
MERHNPKPTYIIANTYSTGDTIVVDGIRYHCHPCSAAMQFRCDGSLWRYVERYSTATQHDLAAFTDNKRIA